MVVLDAVFVEPAVNGGDATIFDVVFDEIVAGELLLAPGQRQHEQRQTERDDNRRERQCLRQRVSEAAVGSVDDRGVARATSGGDESKHGGVPDQRETDHDSAERTRRDEKRPGRGETGDSEDQRGAHASSCPLDSPVRTSISARRTREVRCAS